MDLRVNQLGEIIDISQNEAVKATNALWRSRIQKRIDELSEEKEANERTSNLLASCTDEYKNARIRVMLCARAMRELEGLLEQFNNKK